MANYSFWNGQPVNAPLFPQVGDLIQPNQSCYNGGQWPSPGHSQGTPMQHNHSHNHVQTQASGVPGQAGSHQSSSLNFGGGGMQSVQQQPQQSYPGMGGGAGMPMQSMMGMGDYSHTSSPLTCPVPNTFFSQNQAQGSFEPCIENGEAFCAYNGMDMSMGYGGGMHGQGGAKGGFW